MISNTSLSSKPNQYLWQWRGKVFSKVSSKFFRYAAILFKKQRYVSATHRLSTKIVCKDNFKYEVQERQPSANAILDARQLAEEYWRIDKFFLISFPILFFIFNIIYWLAFILWTVQKDNSEYGWHKQPMPREIDSTTTETTLRKYLYTKASKKSKHHANPTHGQESIKP